MRGQDRVAYLCLAVGNSLLLGVAVGVDDLLGIFLAVVAGFTLAALMVGGLRRLRKR